MATALAFDTHAYVKKLRDVGVPEKQAEVQVEAIAALIGERMATKHDLELVKRDIKELEVELKRDINELKRDIRELETRLLIRLGTLLVVAIGAVATHVKLL
jgi:hypothetical protein